MNAVDGKLENNALRLEEWLEGANLPATPTRPSGFRMLTEVEQSDDPEEVEKWIAEQEAIPPLVMDPEDEARMWESLRATREYTIRRDMEAAPTCPED